MCGYCHLFLLLPRIFGRSDMLSPLVLFWMLLLRLFYILCILWSLWIPLIWMPTYPICFFTFPTCCAYVFYWLCLYFFEAPIILHTQINGLIHDAEIRCTCFFAGLYVNLAYGTEFSHSSTQSSATVGVESVSQLARW